MYGEVLSAEDGPFQGTDMLVVKAKKKKKTWVCACVRINMVLGRLLRGKECVFDIGGMEDFICSEPCSCWVVMVVVTRRG